MGLLNYGVFGGSIPLSDLAPQAAETIVANPTGSTASPQAVTVGVENGFIGTELVSVLDFADYATITGGADATVALQNFRIAGFVEAVVRGVMDKGNLASRCRIKQRTFTGYPLTITSPDIIPPFVDCDAPLQILRNFPSSGSASAFYNGDPTSNAFNNLAMPTVFISIYGHANEIGVNCVPSSNIGAGIAGPRYWQLLSGGSGATVGAGGTASGYTNGDVVTVSIGGLPSPFAAPQFTLTVSGGNVTAVTPVSSHLGILPFPPKMMRAAMGDTSGAFITAWTNPITGGPTWATAVAATATTKATAVYDANGYYITTGGTGTGLTINIPDDTTAWNPDFSGAAATYLFQTAETDTILGNIKVQGAATTVDGTYGPIDAYMLATGEHFINSLTLTGGRRGLYSNAIDVHLNSAHITDSWCALKIASSGDFNCPTMILDSPLDHYTEIDNCEGIILKGRCFTSSGTDVTGSYAIEIGSNYNGTTVLQTRNCDIDFEMDNAGKSTGIPAASIAHIQGSNINLKISNIESKTGATAAKQISSFAAFGSGVANNNRISGRIDGVFGQIYSGTLPGCYFDIWDAEVPLQYGSITATITGSATNNDTVTFTFTNAGVSGFPQTAVITITTSETTTQMATAMAAAINANSALTGYGVSATTNAANVVNIFQSGSQANNTVVTSAVTGGATEIITLSNSGAISGAISGGKFSTGGVYNLIGSGAPKNGTTQATGLGKAIINSAYIDQTNNYSYVNLGSASSPLWIRNATNEYPVYSNGNSGTTFALNMDNGPGQTITITGAVTISQTTPSNPGKYTLTVYQDGTGHVYSFSGIKWAAGTQPTWSTAASAIDVISFWYDGTNYYGMGGVAFA